MKTYNHEWLIAEWERMGRPEVEIRSRNSEVWRPDKNPCFYVEFEYRIKSKPFINWEHVSEEYCFLANDEGRGSFLYGNTPVKSTRSNTWSPVVGYFTVSKSHKSFTQGTCDWKDSLVMRPVVVGEE